MKKISSILVGLVVISCTQLEAHRKVASELSPPSFEENFLEASKTILKDVKSKEFNSDVCLSYLKQVEDELDSTNISELSEEKKKQIFKNGREIADKSWEIRSSLHARLSEFSEACVIQIQSNFKQFRFIEDYLLERIVNVQDLTPEDIALMDKDGVIKRDLKKKELKMLTEKELIGFQAQPIPMKEEAPYYILRQKAGSPKEVEFKGGDLLITRGLSFLSAMIARLGDRGTQFSHVVMVNEEGKEIKTIESYVGAGVDFYKINYALRNENARILWLRPKNKAIGEKANRLMGKFVKQRIESGDKIHYDYALDFKDPTTMSCAEVSQVAYDMATKDEPGGKYDLPYYKNYVSGAKPLLEHMGINGGETYEPGDMEIDPRFELMGEFQDLRLTRDSRHKDAIMTMMFKWMNEENYVLKDSFKSGMAGGFVYKARHSIFWGLVKAAMGLDDFSKEIPPGMLRTVTLLKDIGSVLLQEVKEKDAAFEKANGLPMSYFDLYKVLEDFRVKDLALYKSSKKKIRKQSQIHPWFHPGK